MKVEYVFEDFSEKQMLCAVGDLLKYYASMSTTLREKMSMLKTNQRARDVLTNHLRKRTGNLGVTVDTVFNAVEESLENGDMFSFAVDDQCFCRLFQGKKKTCISVEMQGNYFLTQSVLTHFVPLRGGFRKKYPDGEEGEKLKWLDWMDDNWQREYKQKNFARKVVEE